jgi:hypothetical protein
MPGATVPISESLEAGKSGPVKAGKEEPKNMVRTDAREQKLDKFLKRTRYGSTKNLKVMVSCFKRNVMDIPYIAIIFQNKIEVLLMYLHCLVKSKKR